MTENYKSNYPDSEAYRDWVQFSAACGGVIHFGIKKIL
jgi:hypothetical protein